MQTTMAKGRAFGRVRTTMVTGDYSEWTREDGTVELAFHDYRVGDVGGVALRSFPDKSARDLWWSINGEGKFGLAKRLPAVVAIFELLRGLVRLTDDAAADALLAGYTEARAGGADVEEALMEAVTEPYMAPATDDEPEMPSRRPVTVSVIAQAELDALLRELAARAEAREQAEAGERAAGWDATP